MYRRLGVSAKVFEILKVVQREDGPDLLPVQNDVGSHFVRTLARAELYGQSFALSLDSRMVLAMGTRLIEALCRAGHLSTQQVEWILRESASSGKTVKELMLEKGWIDESCYADLVAKSFGIERLCLDYGVISRDLSRLVSEEWVLIHQVLPWALNADGVLVAVVDPSTMASWYPDLQTRMGRPIRLQAASDTEFTALVRTMFEEEGASEDPEEFDTSELREQLFQLVQENRQAADVLSVLFELCVERGVLCRDEFERRTRAVSLPDDSGH